MQQAEIGQTLHSSIGDASSKVGLLENELAFNVKLSETLARIRETTRLLDDAQNATVAQKILVALDKLEDAERVLASNRALGSARVFGLLENRVRLLRSDLVNETLNRWNELVSFNDSHSRITICNKIERKYAALQ